MAIDYFGMVTMRDQIPTHNYKYIEILKNKLYLKFLQVQLTRRFFFIL